MKVEFQKWGNSLALRIPKAFADELGAAEGKQAEMTITRHALVVKITKRRRYKLDDLLAQCAESDELTAEEREWLDAPPVGHEIMLSDHRPKPVAFP